MRYTRSQLRYNARVAALSQSCTYAGWELWHKDYVAVVAAISRTAERRSCTACGPCVIKSISGRWVPAYVAPRALLTALAQVAGQCPTNRHPKDVACEAARCYELSRLPHCAYRLVPTRPCRVTRNPNIGLPGFEHLRMFISRRFAFPRRSSCLGLPTTR